MATPVVLLTQSIHPAAMERIAAVADVRVAEDRSESGLSEAVATAIALVVRDPVSSRVIEAGRKLRLVARHGVGTDYIPVDVCTARGIPVTITPEANTTAVAEWVVGAMIALAHRFETAVRTAREGQWSRRSGLTGFELSGRTLGIVGCGRIGSRVAAMAGGALNMRVIGTDAVRSPDDLAAAGITPASLTEVLSAADVVSLHVPSTPQTRRLINRDTIRSMKRGSILINSARGALTDTAALVEALSSGQLAGAAMDGLEDEPPGPQHPLFGFDNVLLTPHSAALTEEAMRRMGEAVADEVIRAVKGQPPLNVVNPGYATSA